MPEFTSLAALSVLICGFVRGFYKSLKPARKGR